MAGRFIVVIASLLYTSCSCAGTNIGGDAGIDEDALVSWDYSFEGLGEGGWRDSFEPWCPGIGLVNSNSFDVWSNEGGVYVVVGQKEDSEPLTNIIFYNNGFSWDSIYEAVSIEACGSPTSNFDNIVSHDGDPIFIWSATNHECGLVIYSEGTDTWQEVYPYDIFVVNEDRIFAIASYADTEIVEYNDMEWSRLPFSVPSGLRKIWANETTIFAAGIGGTIISIAGDEYTVHASGTVNRITSIWGFNASDVWAGLDNGELMHYDGIAWEFIDWPNLSGDEDAIIGMWGNTGQLFFHTSRQFVTYYEASFHSLGYWPRGTGEEELNIRSIWGNSTEEVFLAVTHEGHESVDCGPEYLLWWDGSEFHWF
jgi:hypothetical protein